MRSYTAFLTAICICLGSCYHDGQEIAFLVPPPDKIPPNLISPVRVALYIDTAAPNADAAIEAAARYTAQLPRRVIEGEVFNDGPLAYFDYVILSGGLIKLGSVSPYLELTDELLGFLSNHRKYIKPLSDRGIKVLMGITGGNDGITFASLPGEFEDTQKHPEDFETAEEILTTAGIQSIINHEGTRIKNQETFVQMAFARQISDAGLYYRLNGVEFWDKDGEKPVRNPYPVVGETFFSGERDVHIQNERDAAFYWVRGAGNFLDLLAYANEFLGAQGSFQGDLGHTNKMENPILVRDTGFARYFSDQIPRLAFSSTMESLTYYINSSSDAFLWEDEGNPPNPLTGWVTQGSYSPVIIDLASISEPDLEDFSQKLGSRLRADGVLVHHMSPFGLVYITGLGPHDSEQLRRLSVTSQRVFDVDVTYDD